MSSVRSADRRKRPRLGFGTALVPLSRPHFHVVNTRCALNLEHASIRHVCVGSRSELESLTKSCVWRFPTVSSATSLAVSSESGWAAEPLPERNRQTRPRSAEIAARIVRMGVAPLLHQGFEFGVVAVRQHDSGGDEEIAGCASTLRQTLALQPKNPPARGVLGD